MEHHLLEMAYNPFLLVLLAGIDTADKENPGERYELKKWIIQYLEVLLDIIVMFTSYLIANWYKFGFFRTGLINHTEHYLTLFLVELVAYVVVHFVAFADDNLINRKLFSEIYNVLKMYVYVGAITVGCVYFTKQVNISPEGRWV